MQREFFVIFIFSYVEYDRALSKLHNCRANSFALDKTSAGFTVLRRSLTETECEMLGFRQIALQVVQISLTSLSCKKIVCPKILRIPEKACKIFLSVLLDISTKTRKTGVLFSVCMSSSRSISFRSSILHYFWMWQKASDYIELHTVDAKTNMLVLSIFQVSLIRVNLSRNNQREQMLFSSEIHTLVQ